MMAKANALRELQSTGGAPNGCDKELPLWDASQSALMASVLDKAFKGEL
jgi:hypothetical protein